MQKTKAQTDTNTN